MRAAIRNPEGLFEMRLKRERQRIRAEAMQITRRTTVTLPIFSHIPAVVLDRFVDSVHQFDREPILRYSHRLSLLNQAKTLGIRRFDANLIIASIERERGLPDTSPCSIRRTSLIAWGIAAAVQLTIVSGIWWVLTL